MLKYNIVTYQYCVFQITFLFQIKQRFLLFDYIRTNDVVFFRQFI